MAKKDGPHTNIHLSSLLGSGKTTPVERELRDASIVKNMG